MLQETEPGYVVLSCMDYRHMDDVVHAVQNEAGGVDLYDHLILPGAALGANLPDKPHWRQTFFDHLAIALELHPTVHTLLIFEHEECGAYNAFLGTNDVTAHAAQARRLGDDVVARFGIAVKKRILRKSDPAGRAWHVEALDA